MLISTFTGERLSHGMSVSIPQVFSIPAGMFE
jgi:hypothetical protein